MMPQYIHPLTGLKTITDEQDRHISL